MKYIFLLLKENLDMAVDEVMSISCAKKYELVDNLLIMDSNPKEVDFLVNRLGYSRGVYKLLFSCKKQDIEINLAKVKWKKYIKTDFAIKAEKKSMTLERKVAKIIADQLDNPKANLKNPNTEVNIFSKGDSYYCSILVGMVKSDFNARKPHNRPQLHPTSLDPRFARVMINLTGIRRGKLYDLFCGSGGVLLEAGIIGLYPIGFDIDNSMISRARINLIHYGVHKFSLYAKDALSFNRKVDYLVSDLPYGKNTKGGDFSKLYLDFLVHLQKILVKRAVIILPEFKGRQVDYLGIIGNRGFRIIHSYTKYIHNTLSRKIFVIERK